MISTKACAAVAALVMAGATPALAQNTMAPQSGSGMGNGSMMSSGAMSKSQMAAMKKCQAMSSDMMMKNKKCANMAKMHPEMMQGGAMTPSN